jgi:hypothetical protein
MARPRKAAEKAGTGKRRVEQYDHKGQQRKNKPPDRDAPKKEYAYDPHLTERIKAYRGTGSLPFEAGAHKRVTVKIVDDRGIESLKIIPVP